MSISEEKMDMILHDAQMEEYEEEHQAMCPHENAYVQEFRSSVIISGRNWSNQKIRDNDMEGRDKRTHYRSEDFELEAQHYCPDCGKSMWVHFELDDEMFYRQGNRTISVLGESSEVLGEY